MWIRRTAITTGALTALVALTLLPVGPVASADSDLARARAAATQLRDKVDRLGDQAEAAAEDYGAANDALEQVVTRLLLASETVDTADQAAAAAAGRNADVARQMYQTGGIGAIYASVLEGNDISDVLDRLASVDSVVRGDILAYSDARTDATRARAKASDLGLLTAQRRVLEDRLVATAERAAALHAQAQAALDDADALVRSLVEQERAAAEAAAEAQARLLTGAVPWTTNPVPADAYAAVDRAIGEASVAPATPYAVAAITDARRWLGTPYSAGGGGVNGPGTGWCSSSAPDDGRTDDGACAAEHTVGFDCSSLMVRIFSTAGRPLPRTSRTQWYEGVRVPLADIAPGDLLFWANDTSNPGSIHHVALYIGHGLMVHSPHTGDHVKVASVYLRGLIGAVRPV